MGEPTKPLSSHLGSGPWPRTLRSWEPEKRVPQLLPQDRRRCLPPTGARLRAQSLRGGLSSGWKLPTARRQLPRRACAHPWDSAGCSHSSHDSGEAGPWQGGAARRDSKGPGWGQMEWQAGPQQRRLPAYLAGVCESRDPASGFIFTRLGTFLGRLGLSWLLCPLHSLIHSFGKHVLRIASIPGSVLVIRNINECA